MPAPLAAPVKIASGNIQADLRFLLEDGNVDAAFVDSLEVNGIFRCRNSRVWSATGRTCMTSSLAAFGLPSSSIQNSFTGVFMAAATSLFGNRCLLQFEDYNYCDAFSLLAEYREKYLTYNDDLQGTASVTVAAALGGIKLQKPHQEDLLSEVRQTTFLFFGAGSTNLKAASASSRGKLDPSS